MVVQDKSFNVASKIIPHDSFWSSAGIDFDLQLRFANQNDLGKIIELSHKLDDENLKHFPFINGDVLNSLKHLTSKEIENNIICGSYLVAARTRMVYTNNIKVVPHESILPENDIVAYAKIIFSDDGAMDISEIMIDDTHYFNRGIGIGEYIVRMCLEYAKEQKCNVVTLSVHTNNSVAKHVYESKGFKTYHESMYLKI